MKLYICEKPSQAKSIAAVLGASTKKIGFYEGNDCNVTWGVGHLLQLAPPDDYGVNLIPWSLDPLPIVPDSFKMKPVAKTKDQLKIIGNLIEIADSIVVSTDADREGEAIAREIMDFFNWEGKTQRLWLSALDEASIKKALDNVLEGSETENLYQAALGRSRADWITGMNLTIGYTAANLGDILLSVGRVQTPTLKLIVDRDNEIDNFKSINHYGLEGVFSSNNGDFKANWKPDNNLTNDDDLLLDQNIAIKTLEKVVGQQGTIIKYETKRKTEAAPLPFDLGGLQVELSKRFKIGAKETLEIAQSLYETHKATTYPRTDCQFLPETQLSEVKQVIESLSGNSDFTNLIKNADLSIKSKVWNTKKITAHHAIIPTMVKVDTSKMSAKEKNAYILIVTNYLLQFYPLFEYDETIIKIDINGFIFTVSGRTPIIQGWKSNITQDDKKETQVLPILTEGENISCIAADVITKKTTAPKKYTEGTLIQAMKLVGKFITDPELKKILKETAGIGTEATRANIIDTLYSRTYVENDTKNNIVSTKLGKQLINVLPDEVTSPATTAIWEQALDQIALGERTLADFLGKQKVWITSMIKLIKEKEAFTVGEPPPKCPKCSKPMVRKKAKEKNEFFYACSGYPDCKTTQSDPNSKKKTTKKKASKKKFSKKKAKK